MAGPCGNALVPRYISLIFLPFQYLYRQLFHQLDICLTLKKFPSIIGNMTQVWGAGSVTKLGILGQCISRPVMCQMRAQALKPECLCLNLVLISIRDCYGFLLNWASLFLLASPLNGGVDRELSAPGWSVLMIRLLLQMPGQQVGQE